LKHIDFYILVSYIQKPSPNLHPSEALRSQIGDGKAKMAIDTSGGGWQWWASAFDGSNGQRWVLAFDGGNEWQLWQRWTIELVFNGGGGGDVQWQQQRLMAFDGIGNGLWQGNGKVKMAGTT
jgi:hypothetical protein